MPEDQELIEEIRNGSQAAMEVLTRKYYKMIYAFVYRKTGDKDIAYDLTQEIFIKMIQRIHTHSGNGSFKSWLYTIAVNHCRDYWRSAGYRHTSKELPLPDELPGNETSVPYIFERKETRERVKQALGHLPEFQREALILKYFHGLKIKEVADVTNASVPTVKSRLKQGLGKLAKLLERGKMMNRRNTGTDDRMTDAELEREFEQFEQQFGRQLDEYDVEYPSEERLMATIQAIRPHMPPKPKTKTDVRSHVAIILQQAVKEARFISPLFWALNTLFLFVAVLVVFADGANPYVTVLLLAPIPMITGLAEVTKSANSEMAELELSLKYSLQEIILSRMAVISGYNVAVNLLFTIGVSVVQPDVWTWKLILYWLLPFMVVTAAALFVVSRFRRVYGITAALAVWMAGGALFSTSHFAARADELPWWLYALVLLAAFVTAILQVSRIYKRGVTVEFNS